MQDVKTKETGLRLENGLLSLDLKVLRMLLESICTVGGRLAQAPGQQQRGAYKLHQGPRRFEQKHWVLSFSLL